MARPTFSLLVAGLALLLAGGCAVNVHRVALDPARLVGAPQPKLNCPYRLGEVVDARSSTGRAGMVGNHLFLVEDSAALVRSKFEAVGLSGSATTGEKVDARLLHLYVGQNSVTTLPVMVVGVTVGADPQFVLRSQKGSMLWGNSEEEAYANYSRMFDDLLAQLVAKLNARCAVAG